MIVAYVSGHGFGHATRTAEVLRVVRRLRPDLPIVVATTAPAFLFEDVVAGPLRIRSVACDVGLAQADALRIDLPGTLRAWREHAHGLGALLAEEIGFLRSARPALVLGDVPPLAFAAAAALGVPSAALANFSWDWIYRHYASALPELGEAADRCAAAYRACGLLLRLPFAGDLSAFSRVEDVPLVARRPRVSRTDARRRLGLPAGRLALLSFGGVGVPGFEHGALGALRDFHFFEVGSDGRAPAGGASVPDNVTLIARSALAAAGLGYEDVVGAADVVVSKPGYGIVSDAIGAGTAFVYTERGDFPEYPILVEGLRGWMPSAHVGNAELARGELRGALEAALAAPWPAVAPDLSGAEQAARRLLAFAGLPAD